MALISNVLVVDDSPTMRSFLRAAFLSQELAVEILEANSGFEALRMLPKTKFDLLCVDINMPDIHGFELLKILRSSPHKDIPVLVVSSEVAPRDRERGTQLGAAAWLAKPFTPADLRQIVQSMFEAT